MLFSGQRLVGLLLLLVAVRAAPQPRDVQSKIKHLVVLMLENRSFDHRLGYFKKIMPELDGVDGHETNLLNVTDPHSTRCHVSNTGDPNHTPNADHSYHGTLFEQYGTDDIRPPYPPPRMSGFANREKSCDALASIPIDQMPVTRALLENFAVCQRHFAGHPGPTEVNRLFWHSATSDGYCDNPGVDVYARGFPQESLYHRFARGNGTGADETKFGIFMGDSVSTTLFFDDQRTPEALAHYHEMDRFYEMAKHGKLPNLAVIEPRYFSLDFAPANDEHPAHSIYEGELLLSKIYNAVRASPHWERNEIGILISYDEHGGLYDHVPSPTTGVPPPQPGSHCIYGGDPYFDFTRLGVRVPTFLISPWTKKQEILNTPTGAAAPHNTSQFTHSSLSRTVHDLFGLAGSLTDRDAWAGSYAPALTALDAPRNDTPASIPPPPAPADGKTAAEGNQPLNDLQISLIEAYGAMNGQVWTGDRSKPFGLTTEKEGQYWMRQQLAALRARKGV